MFLPLCLCMCVPKRVLGSRDSSLFPKDSRPVSVWQLSTYSHLQTNFPSATGLKSAKPRVKLKLVRLRDTTKWNVSLGVFLTMVHFDPLQCLYEIFPFYVLHTSIISFFFFCFSECICVPARVLLYHPRSDCPAAWGSGDRNTRGSCYRCQSRLFHSAAGCVLGSRFGKPGVHGHVIALGWTATT